MSNKPVRKNRCAIYTRKSSEEGLEMEFNSLDAQREACEAYVASQKQEGWIVLPDVYDDGGVSGGTLDRPALQRLLADIEAGRIDVVVVYKIDRLSRALMDFTKLVEVFDRHSVTFVSVTQQFNTTTSMGRLTLNILLSFAQFEREVTGERIRDKIAASRKKGMWMGGHPPLGYDVVDRKLVVNQEEATLVRHIFERFLHAGSATLLMNELNAAGHTTKSWTTRNGTLRPGRPFDKGVLYKLINNRVYLGEAVHKGKSYPGEHLAIIDAPIWDKVHSILSENARRRGNHVRAATPALLKGLIRCASCDRAMTPSHARKNGRRYRYYVCQSAIKNGHVSCPVRSLPAGEIEEAVLVQVRALLRAPEMVARTLESPNSDSSITEDDAIQTIAALDPLWDELFPLEQARVIRLLVDTVTVTPEALQVSLHAQGLHSLIAEAEARERTTS
ncbi:MAG: resolvase [Magnetovibrio sp.]|nr:resolvase [Magnetovibrio sp.]